MMGVQLRDQDTAGPIATLETCKVETIAQGTGGGVKGVTLTSNVVRATRPRKATSSLASALPSTGQRSAAGVPHVRTFTTMYRVKVQAD